MAGAVEVEKLDTLNFLMALHIVSKSNWHVAGVRMLPALIGEKMHATTEANEIRAKLAFLGIDINYFTFHIRCWKLRIQPCSAKHPAGC